MSNLIVHDYNGFAIPQRPEDGYVNLTLLAKAANKRLDNWTSSNKTKDYITELSRSLNLRERELVIVIQGGKPELQGTWVHKMVAIQFAHDVNASFAVWANTHLLNLIEQKQTEPQPQLQLQAQVQHILDNPDKHKIDNLTLALDNIFRELPIDKALVAGVKMNAIQMAVPELAQYIEPARQLLINSTAKEAKLLSVTELGKLMNPVMSANKLNQLLMSKGFQIKNPNKKGQKDLTYTPTDKAKDHCSIVLSTGANNVTSYQQLRWYDTILTLL